LSGNAGVEVLQGLANPRLARYRTLRSSLCRVSTRRGYEHRTLSLRHKTLTDEQVEACFILSRADPDQGMISGVIGILREHLSAQQFQNNMLSIYELGPYIRKRDLEAQLYQEINQGMTEDLFQGCLSSQSQNIYMAIARNSDIPLIYLERLDVFLQGKDTTVKKHLQYRQFKVRWEQEGFSNDLFQSALESDNSVIQNLLLEKKVLSAEQLKILTVQGTNKKVRDSARRQIKSWENIERKFTV
jgi:hypothetical protein